MIHEFLSNTELITKLIWSLIEIAVAVFLGPFVKRSIMKLSKSSIDKGVLTFIGSLANIAIITMGIILALDQFGFKIGSVVSIFSALGLGVTLAIKDNMANVASGLQILLTKPFEIGDFVRVKSHHGIVKSIELMYTVIVTRDNRDVIVPNSKLTGSIVTNFSKESYEVIRLDFHAGLDVDITRIESKVAKLALDDPFTLDTPAPEVVVDEIKNDSIKYILTACCEWKDYTECRYSLLRGITEEIKSNFESPVAPDGFVESQDTKNRSKNAKEPNP